jgi:hypothetical protein
MKTLYLMILALMITASLVMLPQTAQAQAQSGIPPRAKAFLLVSGYGAAGGAMLGLASMAFGTSSRAVAQGASLGLYAGLLFGTYVLVSHAQRQNRGSYDNSTPYQDDGGYDGDYGEGESKDSAGGGFFDSSYDHQSSKTFTTAANYQTMETKKGSTLPPFQINVFSYTF